MKVRWTPRAVQDLKSIASFIAADDTVAARAFAARLKARAESVGKLPNRGRMMPELNRQDIRELLDGNYRIVYRVLEDSVHILTLFEGHRQPGDLGL